MSRKYSFWFHYNKPASKVANKNILTVHYRGVCHLVEGVSISVPIESLNRKAQPRCVIRGYATQDEFKIIDKVAYIGAT